MCILGGGLCGIAELSEESFQRGVKTFSNGMRHKCGTAIRKEAKAILLHEPTSGLDPKSGKEFCDPARIGRNAMD